MKEFTKEMLVKLESAHESAKGTPIYYKLDMECYLKSEVNGKWLFCGFGIPYKTGKFRKYGGKTFIVTENESHRYTLNDEVKELLGV